MTDPTPSEATPTEGALAPAKAKPSTARIVLTVVVALVAAAGAWIGTTWLLNTIAPKGDSGSLSEPAGGAREDEGFLYVNEELGFSAQFPGEPEESATVQDLGFEVTVTQVQWASGADLALISATVFPPEAVEQDLDTALTNSLAGAAQAAGGTLRGETDAELDGVQAKTATIVLADGQEAEMLVAISDDMQVLIFTSGNVSLDEIAASFSFTG